jgi:hypothetical protein
MVLFWSLRWLFSPSQTWFEINLSCTTRLRPTQLLTCSILQGTWQEMGQLFITSSKLCLNKLNGPPKYFVTHWLYFPKITYWKATLTFSALKVIVTQLLNLCKLKERPMNTLKVFLKKSKLSLSFLKSNELPGPCDLQGPLSSGQTEVVS